MYFVLEYVVGGELYAYSASVGKMGNGAARFYTAQVVEALGYMHQRGIIFRDLKPENLLLDRSAPRRPRVSTGRIGVWCSCDAGCPCRTSVLAEYLSADPPLRVLVSAGYLKVTDFGFAKRLAPGERTYTVCGTPEYIAPEIIANKVRC